MRKPLSLSGQARIDMHALPQRCKRVRPAAWRQRIWRAHLRLRSPVASSVGGERFGGCRRRPLCRKPRRHAAHVHAVKCQRRQRQEERHGRLVMAAGEDEYEARAGSAASGAGHGQVQPANSLGHRRFCVCTVKEEADSHWRRRSGRDHCVCGGSCWRQHRTRRVEVDGLRAAGPGRSAQPSQHGRAQWRRGFQDTRLR